MALRATCVLAQAAVLFAMVTSASAAMEVTFSATPIFPAIPRKETIMDFPVLVRVEAPPASKKNRVPIDLTVLLDIVGGKDLSMEGKPEPARLASVKSATKFIATHLLHDGDRLAVLGPPFPETSLLGAESVEDIGKMVDAIGAADEHLLQLPSGLKQATKILKGQGGDGGKRAGFIILVSDREVDYKVPDGEWSYPVHAFGIGAAHHPSTLYSIADKTHGTYSFLNDGDAMQRELTGAFALCLGGIGNVVAVAATVSLQALGPNKVTSIDSGGYDHYGAGETSISVSIGALYAGEVKSLVVHLQVTAAEGDVLHNCDDQEVLAVSVQHLGVDSTERKSVRIRRPLLDDGEPMPRVPSPLVVQHVVVYKVVRTIKESFVASAAAGGGVAVSVTGSELQRRWDSLVQEHQFWIGLDLGDLHGEVAGMIRALNSQPQGSSSGVAYILAWLSSRLMQRPTAMASPANAVAAFITLEMKVSYQLVVVAQAGRPGTCMAAGCVSPIFQFRAVEGKDGQYEINADYKDDAKALVAAINAAINQMHEAFLKKNHLVECVGVASA